jgi:class 3 adenylate cyclase
VPLLAVPPDRPPRVSATLVQATLRNRAAILTLDAQRDARFAASESIITQGIRSCISAPIWAENRILGVLLLDRPVVHPFTADDLEIATLVGFQAALAMERARQGEREVQLAEIRSRLGRQLGAAAAARLLDGEDARGLLDPAPAEVAVVAAAVDGLAALAAAGPPGEAAARALAVQRALLEAARAEGAAVDQQLDCGVLAVFDIPPGRPDARGRARRAAQAMLGRVAALEGWHEEPRLAVRVGVAAGRALVGSFGGPDSPELRASGDPVEDAQRAAREARPGEAREG